MPDVEGSPEREASRKRRRVVISCTECHRRKQKCDRELPCANCRSRNRETSCHYQPGAPTARDHELRKADSSARHASPDRESALPLSSVAATWGYGQTGSPTSTMTFLKSIETAEAGPVDAPVDAPTSRVQHQTFAVREKYKGLVRQLPAKSVTEKLAGMFLDEFNWEYGFLERELFFRQLDEWNGLAPSTIYSDGPQGLSSDLRVFPAVLFQVMAKALLLVPDDSPSAFDDLKYAQNMTFEDLAMDYSEAGASVVRLFGKRSLSITTVQAEWLRASFLKFTGNVAESWHVVSGAIRDAQELGMHRDSLDPRPRNDSPESSFENQWLIQRRRYTYMMLVVWDVNMSVILGRPGTVDRRHGLPTIPVDSLPAPRGKLGPVVARQADQDPPTPVTKGLWMHALSGSLRDILDLERDGPYPDFSKVDRLHQKILELDEAKPAVFRFDEPDRRWDMMPGLGWLPRARPLLAQFHEFSLMALHRPYVFYRAESRTAAVRASLEMLERQRILVEGLQPRAWRSCIIFFGSFDAIVLIASLLLMFPWEQLAEVRGECMEKVYWAMERLAAMQDRSPLARSAQGVVKAILAKLTRAVGNAEAQAGAGGAGTAMESASWPADWTAVAPMDVLAGIAPVFPTSDLIYHDLTAMQDGEGGGGGGGGIVASAVDDGAATDPLLWQFGGDWGEDTIWQMLNELGSAGPDMLP
ncbi:hypothetical protein CDD83_8247 [Cordyceps sp. RAO-2017]|nr:hypothetical protein CDD83_8247 [Cordyceps sp. RAO-2017]